MYVPKPIRHLKRRLFRRFEGERKLRERYYLTFGKPLGPTPHTAETFTEKIFHRLIYLDHNGSELIASLSDKYLVRNWVQKKIGLQYLIPLLWSGENPQLIPFDTLPAQWIAKTNHGSAMNVVFSGSMDRTFVIRKMQQWLKTNYYWAYREAQYLKIKRRILIEELLDDGQTNGPLDYRFWCFDGAPALVQVDDNRHSLINPFYDLEWNRLDLWYKQGTRDFNVPRPDNFLRMIDIASSLAKGFDFVRVDLYNIYGKIYFAEMTFIPAGGNLILKPASWDRTLGKKWNVNLSNLQ